MKRTGTFAQSWHRLLAISALLPTIGSAATFQVTRLDDPVPDTCLPADCSLREAVLAANALPGRDIIRLGPGIHRLEQPGIDEDAGLTGDIDITDDLDLLGEGSELSAIDPNRLDYALDVARGIAVSLRGLGLIRSGTVSGPHHGGGIRSGNFGAGDAAATRLALEDVLIDVYVGLLHAGLSARGHLSAKSVTFMRALEPSWAMGFNGSELLLDDVYFRGNSLGLSYALSEGGQARITRSRFESNGTSGLCTTLVISGAGTTLIEDVTFKDNFALGAAPFCIMSGAHVVARNSVFRGHTSGSMIALDFGGNAPSRLDLHNVTIVAPRQALSLYKAGSEASLHHTTITTWPAYSVELRAGTVLRSTNSVIAGGCGLMGTPIVETQGVNFEAPNRTCFPTGQNNFAYGSADGFGLDALQENGGPTATILPPASGPLTVLADDGSTFCPPTDQRGYVRPRPCTIGAADPLAIDDALLLDGFDY